jgi:hypothetical protein
LRDLKAVSLHFIDENQEAQRGSGATQGHPVGNRLNKSQSLAEYDPEPAAGSEHSTYKARKANHSQSMCVHACTQTLHISTRVNTRGMLGCMCMGMDGINWHEQGSDINLVPESLTQWQCMGRHSPDPACPHLGCFSGFSGFIGCSLAI